MFRTEKDFLGEKRLSGEVYYGIQTLRALENFQVSGMRMSSQPVFIQAFAFVKKAAAMANRDCGVLHPTMAEAIIKACDVVITGKHNDQFVTDLFQGGAGTSVNMNVNEVIANLALEMSGFSKGDYQIIHPNNHVNCSQSTNDTYPTALNLALYKKTEWFIEILEEIKESFLKKAEEFSHILKMGRTQLQDAVPMYLGQEFHGFASAIKSEIRLLSNTQGLLTCCNMGGTAIGSRINTPQPYPEMVTDYLAEITGVPLKLNDDLFDASSNTGVYVSLSSAIKRTSVTISKICNDLRLLSSGPRAGLHEINLPLLQPGSSIMPGEINPVMPELVNQAAFYAMGMDVSISLAAEAGQLQLNVMTPLIIFGLFTTLDYLSNSIRLMNEKCLKNITVNSEVCHREVLNSVGIVTLLNPYIGYETASFVAREALDTGKSIYEIVVLEKRLLDEALWLRIFADKNLVSPEFPKIKTTPLPVPV